MTDLIAAATGGVVIVYASLIAFSGVADRLCSAASASTGHGSFACSENSNGSAR